MKKANRYDSWFLRLFLPALIFLYKAVIHYMVIWPWWIYKLSADNVNVSWKKKYLVLSFKAIVFSLFVFFIFIGTGLMMGVKLSFTVGLAYSLLPLIWVFGEIALLRYTEYLNPPANTAEFGFGFMVLRTVLGYFLIFVCLLLLQIFLTLTLRVEPLAYSIPGLVLSLNTGLSMIMLIVLVILLFSLSMMPSYILSSGKALYNITNTISFLGIIGRKFLKFLFVLLPASIISLLISILPALLIIVSLLTAIKIKDVVLEKRIETLESRKNLSAGVGQYQMESKIRRYHYYMDFPENFFREGNTVRFLVNSKIEMQKNIDSARYALENNRRIYTERVDSINSLTGRLNKSGGTLPFSFLMKIDSTLKAKKLSFESWENSCQEYIVRNELRIEEVQGRIIQLPFLLFFIIVGLSIFCGFILAGPVAYFGNLYVSLYHFGEDDKPTYLKQIRDKVNLSDARQPLLGLTLLIIIGLLIVYLFFICCTDPSIG